MKRRLKSAPERITRHLRDLTMRYFGYQHKKKNGTEFRNDKSGVGLNIIGGATNIIFNVCAPWKPWCWKNFPSRAITPTRKSEDNNSEIQK